MDKWVQYLLAFAGVVTAVSVVWTKFVRPLDKIITRTKEILPILEELAEQFKNNPDGLKTLSEIASEFKVNGGKSLRDQINLIRESLEDMK